MNAEPKVVPPVMVLGCGRSGTSIFGELFASLGCYEYRSEPDFSALLGWFGPARATKVPMESAAYPADLGLSFPCSTLLQQFPQTRLFWIVRHPLDTICSLRVGIGQGWRHHPRPPDWQLWQQRPLLERCAYHWSYINSVGYAAVQDQAMLVRFEALIDSPAKFAERICEALDLVDQVDATALRVWTARVQNTNNTQFVEAMTSRNHSRNDHRVRVGRWRENLSQAQAKSLAKLVAPANAAFGYQLP